MQAKEREKEVEELNRVVERVSAFKREFDNHPMIKKYWGFTGLTLGFIIIVLFFNNSLIGVDNVETKDDQTNHLDGIGGGVETKLSQGEMNKNLGADKTISNIQVREIAIDTNTYVDNGQIDHVDNDQIDIILGTAVDSMGGFVSMSVVLVVTGCALAFTMAILFKISSILILR
jgi:hypothetical protein